VSLHIVLLSQHNINNSVLHFLTPPHHPSLPPLFPHPPIFFLFKQPSYRVLCLIDKLLLLGVGQAAYLGPPAGLPKFLSSLGSPVPEGSNSTEHGLDVMAVLQAQ
ncbi:unnamed protein product, partial [Closterium sp. NIES-53]